jgi:hypothetical protein
MLDDKRIVPQKVERERAFSGYVAERREFRAPGQDETGSKLGGYTIFDDPKLPTARNELPDPRNRGGRSDLKVRLTIVHSVIRWCERSS